MDENKVDDILFEINGKLSAIAAKLDTMTETVLRHEARISFAEKEIAKLTESVKQQCAPSLKAEVVPMLVKTLMVSLGIIATLTGASGVISMFLGK